MKLLTGKANDIFTKEKLANNIYIFETMLQIYKHALIIEWFDSVGIIIKLEFKHRDGFDYSISYRTNTFNPYKLEKGNLKCVWKRTIATEIAIKKANEIFNNR